MLLPFVQLRSILGKSSWIITKPVYKYLSPIGVIFATIHVVAFGAPGWYKLFKPEYHNGQMSITFMSSMFPMSILTVWFFMKFFSTPMPKKLLRNSFVQLAEERYKYAVTKRNSFVQLAEERYKYAVTKHTGNNTGDNTNWEATSSSANFLDKV